MSTRNLGRQFGIVTDNTDAAATQPGITVADDQFERSPQSWDVSTLFGPFKKWIKDVPNSTDDEGQNGDG